MTQRSSNSRIQLLSMALPWTLLLTLAQTTLLIGVDTLKVVPHGFPVHATNGTYHQPCKDNSTCSIHSSDFTKCDTRAGICVCLEDKMYYDDTRKTCVVYADRDCMTFTVTGLLPCTADAACRAVSPNYFCKCDNGLAAQEGLCVGSHGAECSGDHHCSKDRGLVCAAGRCKCVQENVSHEWSPAPYEMCVGLADVGSCSSGDQGCIRGALCSDKICKCKPLHSSTVNHRCKLALNSTCYLNPGDESETCNENEGLACSLAVCSCAEGTIYDGIDGRCASLVTKSCDLGSMDGPFYRNCVPGSTCVATEAGEGICECDKGFIPSENDDSCVKANNFGNNVGSDSVLISAALLIILVVKIVYIY